MQAPAKRLLRSNWHAPRLAAAALLLPALPARADPEALLAVQRLDQRVAELGYRLASAGGDLCPRQVPLPGFRIHDLSQYFGRQQVEARAVFGFDRDPLVLAVAGPSPAAIAGLRVGDALLAVDGVPVPAAKPGAKDSYARVAAILAQIDRAAADGALELELRRGAERRTLRIALARGCPSKFQMRASGTIDSRADGTYVQINSGLIAFAGSDDQLAAIVAHELAHNILRHRERLGSRRGPRRVRRTEEEADRLSVHLLDRAGYPPEAAIAFWQRYDRAHGFDFLRAPTHMGEEDRIALFREEIARIAAMKAAGKSPRPAFLEGPELPRLD